MKHFLDLDTALPADADAALLIGRVHVAGTGPVLV
jgi:fumarylacetoacetate (FAA) hydrolase family protein